MSDAQFVYVTYIRTTPQKLWQALIEPEFTRRYWVETYQESEWKPGAAWCAKAPTGEVAVSGEILEIDPPRRLVQSWRFERKPELKADGYSRLTYELEPLGDSVRLTIVHEHARADSLLMKDISRGWPMVLASLKSMLETGEPLEVTRHWNSGNCTK